jgi:hypothetical protein
MVAGVCVVRGRRESKGSPKVPPTGPNETDGNGRLSGRDIGGLHESFLEVDPPGIEAEDIRGW